MKTIRQGHTRWNVALYEPGELEGYEDRPVALVIQCFATKVRGSTVHYDCGNHPMMCGGKFWRSLHPTFRQAYRAAQAMIESYSSPVGAERREP